MVLRVLCFSLDYATYGTSCHWDQALQAVGQTVGLSFQSSSLPPRFGVNGKLTGYAGGLDRKQFPSTSDLQKFAVDSFRLSTILSNNIL